MNIRAVRALLKKDVALFMSNRFYFLITVLGLIFYVGAYFLLPRTVAEKLKLGIYAPVLPPAFQQIMSQPGTDIKLFGSVDELKQQVQCGDYHAGVVLPDSIIDTWTSGGKPEITVFYPASAPPEVPQAIVTLVKELAYIQTGQVLNFQTTEEVLDPDLLGAQIALRDRIRPLLAVFILLVEIMSLASLISVEIDQGTARALMVTPLRVRELFFAKGILGIGLALGQALLFMALVGGFNHQPLIVLSTLLLGSVMVVGVGFLLASLARDVNVVTGWGILILIVLAIPGFGAAIPGLLSGWTKIIPSYYLTDTVNRVVNYGAGWSDVISNLAVLTAFTALIIALGLLALRRRYQ